MDDQGPKVDSLPTDTPQAEAVPSRGRRRAWLWVTALVVLTGAAVYLVGWSGLVFPRAEPPLTGELTVGIRHADSAEAFLIADPGAVPVRAGTWMSLQVEYKRPMYTYLLWLDSQGQVVPLYPWNNDSIEVVDANQPPPVRKPTRLVLSPSTITGGWKFGSRGGLETVLLLARRTPLGQETRLGTLLGSLPPTRMRLRNELAIFALDGGGDTVSRNRGTKEEAREVDQPLLDRLGQLRDQFELIRVVRFAHEGE
jgi:hypothetical protein